MLRVGLTGGLGAGKSTVAAWLRELGAPVLEADAIGHAFLAAGTPTHAALVKAFGVAILAGGSSPATIDRRALARRAFASPDATCTLNAILHPPIQAEIDRRLAALERNGVPLAVVEAALFIEAGSQRRFDRLVVVICEREEKIRRYVARTGASRAEAEARLAAQMPDEEKVRLADYVIDNSASREETLRQVSDVFAALRAAAGD